MLRVAAPAQEHRQVRSRAVRGRAATCAATLAAVSTAAAPSPLQSLAPGQWYEIPDSALRVAATRRGADASVVKITAWSGAAFDPRSDRLLVWGGGHEDYAGNEVYAFDLGSLKWTRLSEPSRPDRGRGDSYADGAPRSRHTYDYVEFLPAQRRLVSFGGAALYPYGGMQTRRISEFDPESGTWVTGRRSDIPPGGSIIGAHARFDPASGDVFFVPGQSGALARYSPSEDRWRGGWGRSFVRVHATAAIDPKRRLLVVIGSGTDKPQAIRWSLDRPSPPTDLRTVTSGDKDIERAYAPGFDFHAPSGDFVAWSGGTDVYVLDPDDWRWTRHAPAAGNAADPGRPLRTGTHGRFRYVPGRDLFVLMNGVDRNVFVYRLRPL